MCTADWAREKIFQEFPNPLIPGKVGMASHKCNLTPELYTHTHTHTCDPSMYYYVINSHSMRSMHVAYICSQHACLDKYIIIWHQTYVRTVQQYSCYIQSHAHACMRSTSLPHAREFILYMQIWQYKILIIINICSFYFTSLVNKMYKMQCLRKNHSNDCSTKSWSMVTIDTHMH